MDDFESPPRVFANHVIKQLVQHLLGDDMVIDYEDFLALRTVFRWCGGSWGALGNGDVVHLQLLQQLVSAWGNMPDRVRSSDRVI